MPTTPLLEKSPQIPGQPSPLPAAAAFRHASILVFLLTFLYVGGLPLLYALRFPTVAPVYFFAGDTFYYLNIARHSLHAHGFTFDGEFMTNGFHPLWEYTLVGLERLRILTLQQGPAPLLRVYFVNLLLLAVGAATFCAASRPLLRRPLLALLIVAPGPLWCVMGLLDSTLGATWSFLNGMESALALLCFAAAFFAGQHLSGRPSAILLFAALLGLGTLARLDDIFIACGMAAFAVLKVPAADRRRTLAFLFPFPLLIAAYLAYNWLSLGILLPISGGTKAGFALLQNLKWTLALFLPVITGDGPAALLPGTAQYYGFAERSGRLLQMILPAILCAFELHLHLRRPNPRPRFALVHAMAAGVILKTLYNLVFVQVWYQGFWYYTVSFAVANLILVLWLDRGLDRLLPPPPSPNRPWAYLLLHAVAVLFAFNLFISKRDAEGPVEEQHLLIDSGPLRDKLQALGANRFLEFDDGYTSYVAGLLPPPASASHSIPNP